MSDTSGDVSATVTEQTAPSPSASSDKGRELREAHAEIKALKLSIEQLTEENKMLRSTESVLKSKKLPFSSMSDIAIDVSATVTEQTAPSPSASSDKGRELQEAHDEIKELKSSVEQLTEELAKLKKKLKSTKATLKSKNLEIKKIVEEKKASTAAAEAALRRVLAAQKDGDGLLTVADMILPLEAELELARSELEKLKKDNTALDRPKKSKKDYAEKIVEAAKAGGKEFKKCTLILTEGDSAKALAMAGLSALSDRDYYGVFPLQGKLLNVKKASEPQLKENEQINQLKNILGLENGEDYKNLKYGQVMIMTDQDDDGFHIKGLIISLFHSLWPELLKRKDPSFLSELVTPVVKVTYKDGREGISFFSMVEFNRWKGNHISGQGSEWVFKHYKGLGTSTDEEGKDYFRHLESHKREFLWVDDGKDEEAINLAFSDNAEKRRTWLNTYEPDTFLDRKNLDKIRYCDFVNKELILYAIADNVRSIPCLPDGFKPSQRKAFFCLLQREFKEYKVSELAAFVSEKSGYYHCEQSLAATIIKMAQDYVGAKNINLLLGIGQFGTRTSAGKDAASPRYIFTKLSPLTRFLFPKDDDVLLGHVNGNGNEPITYIPIIPTILVNGCRGIGTGYKTFVPRYCTTDIISKIKFLLGGGDPNSIVMEPSYKGFDGIIDVQKDGEFRTKGVYEVSSFPNSDEHAEIHITELPICPKPNYKKFLRGLKTEDGKKPFIEEIQDNSTKWSVDYKLKVSKENIVEGEDLYEKLGLQTTFKTTNMYLADYKTKEIKKYNSPGEILLEFYTIRLKYYKDRKIYLIKILNAKLDKLSNIKRFIGEFLGATTFRNKDVEELKKGEYLNIPDGASGYDYLLVDVTLAMISHEKVAELDAEMVKVKEEIDVLSNREPKDLWLADLDLLEKELDLLEKELAKLSTPEEAREEAHELQKHELPAASKKRPTEDRESLDKSPDKKEARLGEIVDGVSDTNKA